MIVAGVDGCRSGWVVAVASADAAAPDIFVVPSFERVVDLLDEGIDAIAVDIPIGLPERGPRACDLEARRLLGPRRSTVFAAPPRALLGVDDYPAALALARSVDGKGLSKQAFHLLPKIAEVDRLVDPRRQRSVVEAHPELAFQRLAGVSLPSKHTAEGLEARRCAIGQLLPGTRLPDVASANEHDVLDALALTGTAIRLAEGRAERLGDGDRDQRGLVMEIAW